LKNKFLVTFGILFFSITLVSEYSNDIKIKSGTIEFIKESNKINFLNDVVIDSEFVNIVAESAIYDDINSVISLLGSPSLISSNKQDNLFDGKAKKILFFNDEKVHLIGNASMKYENISIFSNIIIFNPQTGNISSD
jgi:lipopolysaccharide export system protein LptA